jgi:hypothetical protein
VDPLTRYTEPFPPLPHPLYVCGTLFPLLSSLSYYSRTLRI